MAAAPAPTTRAPNHEPRGAAHLRGARIPRSAVSATRPGPGHLARSALAQRCCPPVRRAGPRGAPGFHPDPGEHRRGGLGRRAGHGAGGGDGLRVSDDAEVGSDCFPLLARDLRLTENAGEQFGADLTLMRIGYRNLRLAADHYFVTAARGRTVEPQSSQASNQLAATGWSEARHYATRWMFKSIPSTTGRV
jgi:hypothetical protein